VVAVAAGEVEVTCAVGVVTGAVVAVASAGEVAVAAGARVGVGLRAGPPHAAMDAASAAQAAQASMLRAALRGFAVWVIAHLSPVVRANLACTIT